MTAHSANLGADVGAERGADALGPAVTVEVADGVFAYVQPDGSWWINNTGFVVGSDDVVAIDASSTERRTRALLAAVAAVTATPVRTLVNTHHHGDHTNGNCLFTDAVVVGHRNCRAGVRQQSIGGLEPIFGAVDWGALTVRPPTLVLDDRLDVYVGDRLIELHYVGTPAHTTGDVVAWLPEERVLFAGDVVFNGGTPFVLMGSVDGALDALERVRAFDPLTIVPGHGGIVSGKGYVTQVAGLVATVNAEVEKELNAGVTKDEIAETAPKNLPVAAWRRQFAEQESLHRAPEDLRPRDTPARARPLVDSKRHVNFL